MNPVEILNALRELTARERIEFLPLAPEAKPFSTYPPINKHLHDLKAGAKTSKLSQSLNRMISQYAPV